MLNIPDSVKALYKQDGVRKNFRAHFPGGELPDITNDNIVQESVKFTESICSQDVFKFGLTEASVIEFETVGVANMYGMMIECSSEIDCSSLSAAEIAEIEAGTWDGEYVPLADSDLGYAFFRVPYGVFRVESCPRDHQAMTHRRVTAYTVELNNYDSFPLLPKEILQSSYLINRKAIFSFLFHTNLAVVREVPSQYSTSLVIVGYDSAGVLHSIEVDQTGNNVTTNAVRREYIYSQIVSGASTPISFTELNPPSLASYDKDTVYFGNCVAEALDNAGIDITYSSDGTKKYSTNLSALRELAPQWFSPVVTYSVRINNIIYILSKIPVEFGSLIPILVPVNSGDSAFLTNRQKNYDYDVSIEFVARSSSDVTGYEIIHSSGGVTQSISITPDKMPYTIQELVIDHYRLTEYGEYLLVDSTGNYRKNIYSLNGQQRNVSICSFSDAIDFQQLVGGELELEASFLQQDRNGGYFINRLDNSSATAVPPQEYSQMWFDEYDVEAIGTIRYSYTDEAGEEQIVDYKFGEGASVYDMTDNAVLKAMNGASPDVIESLLDTYFIPHLTPINFTPIDLEMKGLPYIEAGDALTVTAQDGTVCNSYALRRVLNGVQVLSDQIDSESGLIIDSEEGGT